MADPTDVRRYARPPGCFWLTVREAGGGMVSGWIDRDAVSYPEDGAVLYVTPSAPYAEAPRGPEGAARLAEAVRLLLSELRGRAVDRQMAVDNAREALQEWDREQGR